MTVTVSIAPLGFGERGGESFGHRKRIAAREHEHEQGANDDSEITVRGS